MKRFTRSATAILITGLAWLTVFTSCSAPSPESETKAAIVDQLGAHFPNQVLIEQMTDIIREYGLKVDVYSGDNVTVDLYRKLPALGYKLIVFRVHSGLLGVDPKVINRTWLYTNEPYSKTGHLIEQLDEQVTYARTCEDTPWCFAVSAEFIRESAEGQFDDTAIIMMGCDGLHFDDVARAFTDKGASIYIAWDASVMLNYVDNATLVLIKKLCSDGITVKEAVVQTMNEQGRDPNYGSVLGCYPGQSAFQNLNQLIK